MKKSFLVEYSTALSPAKRWDYFLVALFFQNKLQLNYTFLSYIWSSCFQTHFLRAKVKKFCTFIWRINGKHKNWVNFHPYSYKRTSERKGNFVLWCLNSRFIGWTDTWDISSVQRLTLTSFRVHTEKMPERILQLENKFRVPRWSYQTHLPISLCGTKCLILGRNAFLIVQSSIQKDVLASVWSQYLQQSESFEAGISIELEDVWEALASFQGWHIQNQWNISDIFVQISLLNFFNSHLDQGYPKFPFLLSMLH